MSNIIKDTALQIVGIPLGFQSYSKEFGTHTVVLVNGEKLGDRAYVLPGQMLAMRDRESFRFFGISTPEHKILIVQYLSEDLEADLDYFRDLHDFTFRCNMRQKVLNHSELFKPVSSLLSQEPVSDKNGILEYKSGFKSHNVFVKKGSNRYKFINGESNFLEDPEDFYTSKDEMIEPDCIQRFALSKEVWAERLLFDRVKDNTVPAVITLLQHEGIAETVRQAIRLRSIVPSILTPETYWEECEDSERGVASYKHIKWDEIEGMLSEMEDHQDSYYNMTEYLIVDTDPTGWYEYNNAVFWIFYTLLDDSKIEFISKSFQLEAKDV